MGERTAEVGLEKALGATQGQILAVFLLEAALLSTVGGAAGVALGLALAWVARLFFPGVPLETPYTFVAAALGVSLAVGLARGVCLRAARPVTTRWPLAGPSRSGSRPPPRRTRMTVHASGNHPFRLA